MTLLKEAIVSLSLLLCVCNVDSLSLPTIYTKGTHYEVGHDIGSTFKARIQEYRSRSAELENILKPYYNSQKGREVYNSFLSVTNATFPQFIDELQGIADGAEVPFYETFLFEIRSEIKLLLHKLTDSSCTDIALNYVDQKTQEQWSIQAHNEDADPLIADYGYLVDAHIVDPDGHYPEERFTSFTYPGYLPGNAFGFNSAGMVLTMNAVFPKEVETTMIPRYITNRKLLGAQSVAEVFQILDKYNSASGFSLNFGSSTKIPGNQMLYNVEVGPGSKQYSNMTVALANNKDDGHYYHYNMYEHLNISQFNDTSTQHRSARASKLPVPGNVKGIFNILGDTADPDYPIYRNGKGKDRAATIATAVFDLINGTMSVYVDNPKTSEGPVVVFPLPQHKKSSTEDETIAESMDNKLYWNVP
ncbi:beta-alanyl-dopamine/carcinine hydrolase-like [Glandiceps talaboti]